MNSLSASLPQPTQTASHPLRQALLRASALGLAWVLFLLGWALVADQSALLWQRLPGNAADRYAADRVAVALPRLPAAREIQAACAKPLSWRAEWRRQWLRDELAACLSDPAALVQGAAAGQAVAHFEQLILAQQKAASDWLAASDRTLAAERSALTHALAKAQAHPPGLVAGASSWVARVRPTAATTVREPVGASPAADGVAQALRSQLVASQTLVADLARQPMPQRLKGLALAATGLQLVADYHTAPAQVHLATDRRTLADALEWQRRARGYQLAGFDLAALQDLPVALFSASALLVLVAALASRGAALTVAAWALATQLLGLGALLLTDLALTGDPALRYLAQRQFLSFAVGDSAVPLMLTLPLTGLQPGNPDAGPLVLWWPLVGVALVVLVLGMARAGSGLLLAPVRLWVRGGASGWGGAVQSTLLVVVGAAIVLLLGMPAAVSELLIFLGCVGVASYLARQAPLANAGAGLQLYNLAVVAVALVVAVGASLYRGDLGHVLVAMLLAACFAWLFGWRWLRWSVVAVALVLGGLLAQCLWAGQLTGPLGALAQRLPPHAQDRFAAMFDPFHAGSSDLARTRWLMDSAGTQGWGLGYVPWQGLTPARTHDALPLQGPSDYVLALAAAVWGKAGGLGLMGLVLLLFGAAAAIGLRTALKPAMPVAVRWLAAVGGFGCMVMAAKVVLSVGGVSGVLPLTGLPVSLLGYGPMTHLAALLYLAMALGAAHVVPVELQRGVHVARRLPLVGAVRRRAVWLGGSALAGLAVLLAMAYAQLAAAPADQSRRHLAQARLDMAQAVAAALVPAGQPATASTNATPWPCPELAGAVAAWNEQLASLQKAVRAGGSTVTANLRIDATRLLAQPAVQQARSCPQVARTLGRMLDTDLQRIVGREALAGPAVSKDPMAQRLSGFDKPRTVGARPLDYATPNVWWGRPGCLTAPGAADCEPGRLDATSTDIWLDRQFAPQVHLALRSPSGTTTVNHHTVAVGPALGLTLDPMLQPMAQRLADCATGRLVGTACQQVWPNDSKWRDLHYLGANALRAGAMGITVARVDTGRVVAMAGAVSDCTLDHLARAAVPDANGQTPAVRGNARCAQLPDQRSAWLAQQHPALWMVPPGSSLKPFSLVAGMDAGLLGTGDDAYWKSILAESHERLPIQRTALAAGPRYLNVLQGVGFGAAPTEILWGGPASTNPKGHTQWPTDRYAGTSGLRATSMTLDRAEQIRREKLAGVNVDKRYGEAVTREFMAARSLADASVGGGDIRINAVGLLDAWRALDMRARGHTHMPALHFLEQGGRAPAQRDLGFMSQQAATRALGMTSGVASSAWKGTAQGSCRVVYGACPAQGVPSLSGKTGSSDFLMQEDSPWVKPGLQVPAKLFGGVFTGADGQRYAVAVMALRVREGESRTLELKPSAPAEAALTVMRQMGVASGVAPAPAPVLTKRAERRP